MTAPEHEQSTTDDPAPGHERVSLTTTARGATPRRGMTLISGGVLGVIAALAGAPLIT